MTAYLIKEKNGPNSGMMFNTPEEAEAHAKALNDIPDDKEYIVVPVQVGWANEF